MSRVNLGSRLSNMPGSTNDTDAGDAHHNFDREVCTFVCPQCDSKFSRLAHLRRHEMTRKSTSPHVVTSHVVCRLPSRQLTAVTSLRSHRPRRETVQLSILSRSVDTKGRHCPPYSEFPSRGRPRKCQRGFVCVWTSSETTANKFRGHVSGRVVTCCRGPPLMGIIGGSINGKRTRA